MIKSIFLFVIISALLSVNYHYYMTPVETDDIEYEGPITVLPKNNSLNDLRSDANQIVEFETRHTHSRPLFNESRRKFVPKILEKPRTSLPKTSQRIQVLPKQPSVKKPITSPELILLGVSILPEKRTALIMDKKSNKTSWFKPSDLIQGWELNEISSEGIVLTNSGQNVEYSLYKSVKSIGKEIQ
ncbi:MAG: hypothetical protein AAGD96_07050 [Chloroflexota bacterium]